MSLFVGKLWWNGKYGPVFTYHICRPLSWMGERVLLRIKSRPGEYVSTLTTLWNSAAVLSNDVKQFSVLTPIISVYILMSNWNALENLALGNTYR